MATNLKNTKTLVKYKNIIIPVSTHIKDSYWKYFGYPADDLNNIITRNRVICTICKQSLIYYCDNTTNLKAHLNSKHSKIVEKLNSLTSTTIASAPTTTTVTTPKTKTASAAFTTATTKATVIPTTSISNTISSLPPVTEPDVSVTTPHGRPTLPFDITYLQKKGIMIKQLSNKLNLSITTRSSTESTYINSDAASVSTTPPANCSLNKTINDCESNNEKSLEMTIDDNYPDNDYIDSIIEEDSHSDDNYYNETNNNNNNNNNFNNNSNINNDIRNFNNIINDGFKQEIIEESIESNATTPTNFNETLNNSNNNNIIYIEKLKTDIQQTIIEMLVNDLISPKILDGQGFKNLLKFQVDNVNVDIPTNESISNELIKLYNKKSMDKEKQLKLTLKNVPFALAFEKWSNIEGKTFITVIMYYLDPTENNKLQNYIIETKEFLAIKMDWEFCFRFIEDRKQLIGVILNYIPNDDDLLKLFLDINDIPFIFSMECIIEKSVTRYFNETIIQDIFNQINDFINEYQILNGENENQILINECDENFWLTKYNYLENFYESCSRIFDKLSEAFDVFHRNVKSILDCLAPLKIALETLSNESVPIASLLRPLANQLIELHFNVNETDTEIEMCIKNIIREEFEFGFLNNKFLCISSFMDPRFSHLISPDDVSNFIKDHLYNQYDGLNKMIIKNESEIKVESSSIKSINKLTEKSGLSIFFKNDNNNRSSSSITTNNSQIKLINFMKEFDRYTQSVNISLNECPIKWWTDIGFIYPKLQQLSHLYSCLPAFTNKYFKLPLKQQINYFHKRNGLSGDCKLINALLWLNYNNK